MEPRSLVNDEGSSNKFWSIRVDGATHTVHFGRVGTDGQVKTKQLASPEKAIEAAEKLVAEKLRKGYRDSGTPGELETPLRDGAELPEAPPPPAPPAPPAPEPPLPATASAPVAPPAPARVDLDVPEITVDWWDAAWRTWEPVPELPTGTPLPYDPERIAKRLKACARSEDYWSWTWREWPFAPPLEPEEALAWLELAYGGSRSSVTETADALRAGTFAARRSDDDVLGLAAGSALPPPLALYAASVVIGAQAVIERVLDEHGSWFGRPDEWGPSESRYTVCRGVRAALLPQLPEAVRDAFSSEVADRAARAPWPPDTASTVPSNAHHLAAQLGLHDIVADTVASWEPGRYAPRGEWGGPFGEPHAIVHGLGSAELVVEAHREAGLGFHEPWQLAAWLATAGAGDERLFAAVEAQTSKPDAERLLGVLVRAAAPELAPGMAVALRGRAAPVARAWLDDRPLEAAVGLGRALTTTGKVRAAALGHLQRMHRGGQSATLEQAAAQLEPEAASRLREDVLSAKAAPELAVPPAWLAAALETPGARKLPAWLVVEELPELMLDGTRVGPELITRILLAFAVSTPEAPHPITALREHATTGPLARSLFDGWLAAGAPSKDKWAFLATGWLGDDAYALELAPMVRAWPGEAQHARAVIGLTVLGLIGSDTALMQLSGMAAKLKFKALQQRAREAMDGLAAARGMSTEELGDRIVPDCGLDADGTRVFDFGPRQFSFVLGPGIKPMLRDAGGKVRGAPPKPGAKDHPVLAPAAVEEWKLLRKTVADVVKVQGARLEQAMVGGRRWSVPQFEELLAGHPLQRHLVRLLVLGAYADGELVATFRLTEEGDLADADDGPYALPADAAVSIVHPLTLDEATRAAWGEVLADYEVVPPFGQLGRPLHDVEPGELELDDLTRFKRTEVGPGALVRTLDNAGWRRGETLDGGVFCLHGKHFPGADLTAVVEYENGVPIGYIMDAEPQRIEHVYVLRGSYDIERLGYGWSERYASPTRLCWRDVDPVVRCEVLTDVLAVVAKGAA